MPGRKHKGKVDTKGRECTLCETYKTWDHFSSHKSSTTGYYSRCKKCSQAAHLQWKRKRGNRLKARRASHNSKIKKEYGIDINDYDKIFEAQGGKCKICGGGTSKHFFATDHNHSNGNVRGLLCARCNTGLARFMDRVENLERAVKYMHDDGQTVKEILDED